MSTNFFAGKAFTISLLCYLPECSLNKTSFCLQVETDLCIVNYTSLFMPCVVTLLGLVSLELSMVLVYDLQFICFCLELYAVKLSKIYCLGTSNR